MNTFFRTVLIAVIISSLVLYVSGCGGGFGGSGSGNYAPVASDIIATTPASTPVLIELEANDPDQDQLTFFIAAQPSYGVLDTMGLPVVEYTPEGGFSGVDTFTFYANDGGLDSNTATVYIGVDNSAPVASNTNEITPEDTVLNLTLQASDLNGDTLDWVIDTEPLNGVLSGTAPDLAYTPDANYNGNDSLTFHVSDRVAESGIATVNITITAVNDAPVAEDQEVTAYINTPVGITLTGSDVENGSLTFFINSSPANGSLDTSNLPLVEYTPDLDYVGTDSFTFYAHDGTDPGPVATVLIHVFASSESWTIQHTLINGSSLYRSALGPDNTLHVICQDFENDMLIYVGLTPSSEYSEQYSMSGYQGGGSIVVDYSNGRIHFATVDQNVPHNTVYRSKPDSTQAVDRTETVNEISSSLAYGGGHNASIALMLDGKPVIAYREPYESFNDSPETRVVLRISSGSWLVIKSMEKVTISDECLAVDAEGTVHFIYNLNSGSFPDIQYHSYYTYYTEGQWQPVVEVSTGFFWVRLRVDENGNIHALAVNAQQAKLSYLTNASGVWAVEALDVPYGIVSVYSAFDVDNYGNMHIVYSERSEVPDDRVLKYLTNASGTWEEKTVDSVANPDGYYDVTVSAADNGIIYIASMYYELTDNHLVYITNEP